jgi:hypothetical protein
MMANPGESAGTADKDVLIRDMTRALRAAFKTSSMYRPDHPAFKSGVDDLLARLEALFAHLSPMTIGFTPHALFIDGRFWGDDPAYRDLARLFHFRKIKRMEIRPGLPREEFMRFASKIMLPVKAFIKEGGARAILERERIVHIALEVLDYSRILQGDGEEIKDIWPYLLMEAVEENDGGKLDELAGSFEKVVGRFNTDDLVQNEELHRNLAGFFRHLKASSAEKHRACAKKLLKSIASVRKTPPESKFENLKLLVSDLSEEDLASTLWEEIVDNEKFDSLGFSIFSRIIDRDRQAKVASSLQGLFHTENPRNRKPEVEEKIRILLSGTSTRLHSEIYRQVLENLLNDISFEKKQTLDRELMRKNYRFLLLTLLSKESEKPRAVLWMERIAEEWENAAGEDGDWEFLQDLCGVLESRVVDLADEEVFYKIRMAVSEYVENEILRGGTRQEIDVLVDALGTSRRGPSEYADAVFEEGFATPSAMKAFFRFFPGHVRELPARIKRHRADAGLLRQIADVLGGIDTPASLDVLKAVYAVGDTDTKIRVLRTMKGLRQFDEKFLYSALDDVHDRVKVEALIVLKRRERTKHVAFAKLFNRPSPYGLRNKQIIRNLRMVEESGIRDARPYIEPLAVRKDAWNRGLRREAGRILEAWREG